MRKVKDGIHQLEIPMRRNPLGKTFSYLLQDSGTLIDTGIPSNNAFSALEMQLSILGLQLSDIKTIIVTHMHTDHVGLIERIREKTAVNVKASDEAVLVQRKWDKLRDNAYEETKNEITAWGGSRFLKLFSQYEHSFRRPRRKLEINDSISDRDILNFGSTVLEAIWTPGHANEHVCLYDRKNKIFFSGDHVLPKITSHISHHTYLRGDPLSDYLESLDKVRDLPVKTVLPGHERIFHDLSTRVQELEAHHKKRCREILATLRSDARTVFEVSSIIHWDSQPWERMALWTKRMAAAETYAHLVYMKNRNLVREEFQEGILKYETV